VLHHDSYQSIPVIRSTSVSVNISNTTKAIRTSKVEVLHSKTPRSIPIWAGVLKQFRPAIVLCNYPAPHVVFIILLLSLSQYLSL
jgi:hypothetical protein